MLRRLSLRDFVIVTELEVEFDGGFSVLTGETGAGKSILVDALQLALGSRGDVGVVREGSARTEISAEFDLPTGLAGWLDEAGFDAADTLLLRRTIDAQGKSRAWINGSPATVAQLREAADWLVDIHGPHAWQSLRHAQRYVENIRAALAAAAPSQAAAIDSRARAYLQRIAALDADAQAAFAAVPREQRRVVSSHDAFGYLGEAYGVTFVSPRAWNTDSEASAASVAAVIRQLRLHRARALFVENISDRRSIERIAQETGAQVGGTLYSDALSAPGGAADTYLRLYAHNVKTLATALQAAALR